MKLSVGEERKIKVPAAELYSPESIEVLAGQEYEFTCKGSQVWIDFFIPTHPKGYNNRLANVGKKELRLKTAKCFCLCGVYNKKDATAFAIATQAKQIVPAGCDGELSFFANDVLGFYWQNWLSVEVVIKRIA